MPTLSITLGTAAANELNDAFSAGYQATLPGGGANPETRQAYAKRKIIELLKEHVKLYRKREAARATEAQPDPDITP